MNLKEMLKIRREYTLSYRGMNDTTLNQKKNRRSQMRYLILVMCFFGICMSWSSSYTVVKKGSLKTLVDKSFSVSSENDLTYLNQNLKNADEILIWACASIPKGKLVQVTSFGPTGLVILHKLHSLGCLELVPSITIDTLHLFKESYELWSQVEENFPEMNLQVFRPEGFENFRDDGRRNKAIRRRRKRKLSKQSDLVEEFSARYGENLWKENPDKYAYLSKVEPTIIALNDLNPHAWITGRRKSQGGERSNLLAFETDELSDNYYRFKINPLFDWTYEEVWNYIRKHNVSYNPLHDEGYKSIGDFMTTSKVLFDADERSGRFKGLNRSECGIHSHKKKIQKMREEGLDEDTPTLLCDDCLDLDESTFISEVVQGSKDFLIEFYSPLCGACQNFSPTFDKIATMLKSKANLEVARFAITFQDIPQSGVEMGFDIQKVPQLYLVTRTPLAVTSYPGENEFNFIIDWLKQKGVQ